MQVLEGQVRVVGGLGEAKPITGPRPGAVGPVAWGWRLAMQARRVARPRRRSVAAAGAGISRSAWATPNHQRPRGMMRAGLLWPRHRAGRHTGGGMAGEGFTAVNFDAICWDGT
jgi:hypothetical protein